MPLPDKSSRGTGRKFFPGCLLWGGLALLLLLALLYFLWAPLLTALADGLIVDDGARPADIIFILNGDYNSRPFKAAELFSQGLAPKVVIARAEDGEAVKLGLIPNETDISVGILKRMGVPADKIEVLQTPGGVTSTFDEAAVLHNYAEAHKVGRVILVTSQFHSRRARWIFQRELKGMPISLDMVAVPYATFDRTDWWTNENGLITLNNEYIKLIFYYIKYR